MKVAAAVLRFMFRMVLLVITDADEVPTANEIPVKAAAAVLVHGFPKEPQLGAWPPMKLPLMVLLLELDAVVKLMAVCCVATDPALSV